MDADESWVRLGVGDISRDEDINDEELVKLHHFTAAELTACWAL